MEISNIDWEKINKNPELFEEFQDKVNWGMISQYPKLSEEFIEKFQNKVYWFWISKCQKLSEKFIEKFQDNVDWEDISEYQKLSEEFIEKFQGKVYWFWISKCQKLSEEFIEKFKDKVDWEYISKYQKLSQGFIKKSQGFIKKYNLKVPENNMFYFTKEQKLNLLNSGEGNPYEMDGEHLIAYKATRHDGFSVFNFQYQYEVGKTYESHADGNLNEENSFGLSAWTKEEAINYHNNGELYKIKVHLDDVVAIVHEKKKLRCSRIEVIEKIY
jgi:ribosomal protein L24E